MPDVHREAPVPVECLGQRREQLERRLGDPAAVAADQVDVLVFADTVVGRRAVRQVRVGNQAEFLQQLQRPIDRGDIHPGRGPGHLAVHLIGRGVPQRIDRLKHQLPLGGEPEPTGAQLLGEGRGQCHPSIVGAGRLPEVSTQRVVALLGRGVVPADTLPLASADTGALPADGVFETVHVHRGQARLLDAHLARMRGSAVRLGLDLPEPHELAGLANQAVAGWPDGVEGALRLVCLRGTPVFATIAPVPERSVAARRHGLTVITASPPPGSPTGMKSLPYAANLVQLSQAHAAGADDVLWVSADGWALEGPTSSLVWLSGATLCSVAVEPTGILPGITASWLLAHAGEFGWTPDQRMITVAGLAEVDAAWLTSAVRGVAAIRSVDGVVLPLSPATTALRRLLTTSP